MIKNYLTKTLVAGAICAAPLFSLAFSYSENFDSYASGGTPAGWESGVWRVTNAESQSAPNSFFVSDMDTGFYATTYRPYASLGGERKVTVSFDLMVKNYADVAENGAGTVRMVFNPNNAVAGTDAWVIGLGYGRPAGAATPHLFFYTSANSNVAPLSSNWIGYDAATGFAPGFNLGATNGTDNSGTNGAFYRFELTYDSTDGGMEIVVTNLLDPSQSASFSGTWNAVPQFTSTGYIRFTTGGNSKANVYVDNISIVPEPGTVAAMVGGFLLLICGVTRSRLRR